MICGALRDLVPLLQSKKCEKHQFRSFNFNKVAVKSSTPPWVLVMFFRLYRWYQISFYPRFYRYSPLFQCSPVPCINSGRILTSTHWVKYARMRVFCEPYFPRIFYSAPIRENTGMDAVDVTSKCLI